jgi:hypothetical protein
MSGCKDGRPARVPVSGKVLIDGQPVKLGNVTFYPKTARGRPSNGTIQPDGSFSLFTFTLNDGAPTGSFDVAIHAKEYVSKNLNEEKFICQVPRKYEDVKTSGIEKTIEGPTNDMTIELTWKGSGHKEPFLVDGNKQ